ncbi:uncharacterized protein EDB91DRAFT_1271072, partial [Suillus paluster]|uniref:uncharacterized protein n=1 Tax=Suillus paluster TaxID=48578 RepID=UPI001B8763E0
HITYGHPYHLHSTQVLLAKELVVAILDGLNLRDLLNIAQTCTTMRGVVLNLIEKYKHQILTLYILSECRRHQFFAVLTATRGVITGSCALNMILGSPSYPTNNLNIIVAAGEFDTMARFLTDDLFFVTGSTTIHRIMRSTVQTFTEFNHLGARITLTESRDKQDVIRVIINCPTTADMSFITPRGAATLYPTMTIANNRSFNIIYSESIQVAHDLGTFEEMKKSELKTPG